MAFDKDIVINAIQKEYGQKNAESYLEKIIQVDYTVPAIRKEKMSALFIPLLESFLSKEKISYDKEVLTSLWDYNGLSDYFHSIRDVKRFINSLKLRMPGIAKEVNTADFIAIEAIRLFDNEGYRTVYNHLITNKRQRIPTGFELTNDQFGDFSLPTKDIIIALFAKSGNYSFKKDPDEKGICVPEYFERYFSLEIDQKDIRQKEFEDFMLRCDVRTTILNTAVKFGTIESLLNKLDNRDLSVYYPNYEYELINTIFQYFNNRTDLLESCHYEVSKAIINLVCSSKRSAEYLKTFINSFNGQLGAPSMLHIYYFHYMRELKNNGGSFDNQDKFDTYYKERYDQIRISFEDMFFKSSDVIFEPRYSKECPFIKYIYLMSFAELFPEKYGVYFQKIIEDKVFAFYIVKQIVDLGSKGSTRARYNNLTEMKIFPSTCFSQFHKRIKDIEDQNLTLEEAKLQKAFLEIDFSNFPTVTYPTKEFEK